MSSMDLLALARGSSSGIAGPGVYLGSVETQEGVESQEGADAMVNDFDGDTVAT